MRLSIPGNHETARLAHAFNAMADTMAAQVESARQTATRLDYAIRGTSDGIWDWDLLEDSYHLSPRYRELLGYTEEELPNHRASFLKLLHPDDRPRVDYAIREHFEQRDSYDIEYRLRTKAGPYRWFQARGQAVWDDHGCVIRFAGGCTDITEKRQAEQHILTLKSELEHRVRDRTAELLAANRELEAFSYSVSHDLSSPLRGIDGFSRMLQEDYAGQLDGRGQDYLSRIRNNTHRMQQLIDDLLRLSRVTRDEMRREQVNLSLMAGHILSDLQLSHPERKVDIRVAPEVEVRADPNLLRIALENLLRNAWKFTAHHQTARIEFGTLKQDGGTVFFVRDDGAGFDMKYATKLFGAFQRMHRNTEFEGTGIGLAIVSRIIERHGGLIWAESEIEQGTVFFFTLD